MKKKIFLSLVLFLFAGNVFAQSGWQLQNPFPQTKTLNDCQIIDANTIFAVGNSGTIIKSTNGGSNWQILNSGTSADLWRVNFLNLNTGYVIGFNSNFLKTTDAGNSWTKILITGSNYIKGISFINVNTGVIVGWNSLVAKTTNAGLNWTNILLGLSGEQYWEDVFCIDENTIVITSADAISTAGNIFKTTNGGLNWVNQSIGSFPYRTISDIHYINSNTGFVSGSPVMKTTNGGTNWTSCGFSGVNCKFSFRDSSSGFCAGATESALTVLKTTDFGNTWQTMPSTSIDQQIKGLSISGTGSLGIVVGLNGLIGKTVDFNNWAKISYIVTAKNLNKISKLTDSISVIVGDYGEILRTSNAGQIWYKVNGTSPSENYRSLKFINSTTGFAGGGFFYAVNPSWYYSSRISKTTNSGLNWSDIYFSSENGELISSYFVNENTGYFITSKLGSNIRLFKTSNGGLNWSVLSTGGINENLIGTYFITAETGFIWKNTGEARRTSDGGNTWSQFQYNISNMQFIDNSTGFLISGSMLAFTTDAGLNFTERYPNLGNIQSLFFFNENTGYVISEQGAVSYTNNNGLNWNHLGMISSGLKDICFLTSTRGFIVGNTGTIFSTINGGFSTEISNPLNLIIQDFSLSQNYPNPFNPSTKMNYEIKNSGYVSLIVFDLLGKEVATLVNEKQNAGSYAVDFNSSEFSLPSGIYFYTLNAGEFTETKKMILIK